MNEPESSYSIVGISSRITEFSSEDQSQSVIKERMILEDLIIDVEQKAKVLHQLQAVVEISQASEALRKEEIKL